MPLIIDIPIYASIGGLYIGDMIVVLASFLIVLFLVKKFAWGPVMDMMKKREDYVLSEIENAERNREDAKKKFTEAEERLQSIKKEAHTIIEDAKSIAKQQEEDIIAAAKEEAIRLKDRAAEDIQQEKEKALDAVQDKVAELSVLIATKVIEKELNEQDQKSLIDDYVKQLGESHE